MTTGTTDAFGDPMATFSPLGRGRLLVCRTAFLVADVARMGFSRAVDNRVAICYHAIMKERMHTLTVRLDRELAEQLELVARARRLSAASFVREAIKTSLAVHLADPDLRREVADQLQRTLQMFEAADRHGS